MVLFEPASCELVWRGARGKVRQERLTGGQLCIVAPRVELSLSWREKAGVALFYVLPSFLRIFGCGEGTLRGVHVRNLASIGGHDALVRHLASIFETFCADRSAGHNRELAVAAGRVLTGRVLKFHFGSLLRTSRDGCLSSVQQRNVDKFFEANLHRTIEVEELLGLVFLSKAHFIRLFTRTYGAPPVRHHLFRRLQCAESMLLRTDRTILDAVERFGFGDQSYFNRAFLKFLKYRPGALLRLRNKRRHK
jgi:AraC family transcriptional regulator